MPVRLPMGQGVWEVRPSSDLADSFSFIPIPPGAWNLREGFDMLNDAIGQVGYMLEGTWLYTTQDILAAGVTHVDMKLIVVDINSLSDYEQLPIPPDTEAEVITQAFNILAHKLPTDNKVDSAKDYPA
ncbi:hypothetical protein GCM10027051_31320 [Niabella terrae]